MQPYAKLTHAAAQKLATLVCGQVIAVHSCKEHPRHALVPAQGWLHALDWPGKSSPCVALTGQDPKICTLLWSFRKGALGVAAQ